MQIINIDKNKRTKEFIDHLIKIWESSVRATHLFLQDYEIKNIKNLIIVVNKNNTPIAFMGIENQKLEMLFISANERGKGFGTKLLKYGIKKYSINKLTVNEQNSQARQFYEKNTFQVYNRTELDEQGNPYPLLYMNIK